MNQPAQAGASDECRQFPLILRDVSPTWDMGYCCSVVRADGKIVTMYYYHTEVNFENHIAATPVDD